MSLYTLATTSFPAIYDTTLPPSAFELRHILLDHESVDKLNLTFPNDSTQIAQFQYLGYIAQNIKHVEWELD